MMIFCVLLIFLKKGSFQQCTVISILIVFKHAHNFEQQTCVVLKISEKGCFQHSISISILTCSSIYARFGFVAIFLVVYAPFGSQEW